MDEEVVIEVSEPVKSKTTLVNPKVELSKNYENGPKIKVYKLGESLHTHVKYSDDLSWLISTPQSFSYIKNNLFNLGVIGSETPDWLDDLKDSLEI